jgi:urease accessory protein
MSDPAQISPEELHLLYILLDSNLPTGGFVSSSGLESYVKHGFLGLPSYSTFTSGSETNTKEFTAVKGVKDVIRGVTDFAEAEVGHYANTTGCFVRDSWDFVDSFLSSPTTLGTEIEEPRDGKGLRGVLKKIEELDGYHESTLLSHVARRASKAQGVAMLTLFGRGLTRPVGFDEPKRGEDEGVEDEEGINIKEKEKRSKDLIDAYKLLVRKGSVPGHLAICWGVITAALGLALGMSSTNSTTPFLLSSLFFRLPYWCPFESRAKSQDRSIHLYLFLHARSLLSTAVRMNIIGPYASSQMLLHPFKDIIERETLHLNNANHENTTTTTGLIKFDEERQGKDKGGFWDWTKEAELGPATTWPLGELLMARHDMQHSRIFNS